MDVISELEQQRDSLKQNIHDMNENIKKLTGRDPGESRRLSATKRIQLKRNSFGTPDDNLPNKRANTERRRWGNTAMRRVNNLDSGGEEQEEKKPAIPSSVVVMGKPIEPLRPLLEDTQTKKRNKRMFGLLMGTLQQFKRESQVKTEQEARREEKLLKVDEQVEKDKEDAVIERRELFQTRRGKQHELKTIEFRIEMAQLNEELKIHYEKISSYECIQLKSTPRIFYKPAQHNDKTTKLLKQSQASFKESLDHRMREISMCTAEDTLEQSTPRVRSQIRTTTSAVRPTTGKSVNDPIIIDQAPAQRDLFAEDADNDQHDVSIVGNESSIAEPSLPQSMDDIGEPIGVLVEEDVECVETLVKDAVNTVIVDMTDKITASEGDEKGDWVEQIDNLRDIVVVGGGEQDVDTMVVDDTTTVAGENTHEVEEDVPAVENIDSEFSLDNIALPPPPAFVFPHLNSPQQSNIQQQSPKTDDEALHDEFAAKLLEEAVDEDRRVVLATTPVEARALFSVVDERIVDAVGDGKNIMEVSTDSFVVPVVSKGAIPDVFSEGVELFKNVEVHM